MFTKSLIAGSIMLAVSNVNAAVDVFYDGFEKDTIGTGLHSLINWYQPGVYNDMEIINDPSRGGVSLNLLGSSANSVETRIISNDVITLTGGNTYRVSFDYFAGPEGDGNAVWMYFRDSNGDAINEFPWDGTLISGHNQNKGSFLTGTRTDLGDGWFNIYKDFAVNTDMEVRLMFQSLGDDLGDTMIIDNVRVTNLSAVPLPISAVLFSSALIGLSLIRRRSL